MRNVEIKARCPNVERTRGILDEWVAGSTATFSGIDNQTDTYFECAKGRLKLREGNIENFLIAYDRDNDSGPKESKYTLVTGTTELKTALFSTLNVKKVVRKQRGIYFVQNVKIHLDTVEGLGNFIEIEARDTMGFSLSWLEYQCTMYMELLNINKDDLLKSSYSDMLE